MPQIVHAKSPVLAAVTDVGDYVLARKWADNLAAKYCLIVADMPMAIQAMAQHPRVRNAIRPGFIDTITFEYHGLRKGKHSYEAWHSAGSLSTLKGLEDAFSKIGNYGFMPISNNEWIDIEKGNYNCHNVARLHLDDVKNGNVPATGTPYTIFVRLDKDAPNINIACQLNYDAFMLDDRVLMIAGSLENREALAKMLFGRKTDGGEGWDSVGSHHRINKTSFNAKARGRPICLDYNDVGLVGYSSIGNHGCFVGVNAELQASKIGALVEQQSHKTSTSSALDDCVKDTFLYVPSIDPKFVLKK